MTGSVVFAADDPALPGHFPGDPLVPGVLLLDEAAAAILALHPGHRLAGVLQAKFLRPVGPGDRVCVHAEGAPPRIAFECRVGDEVAVRGTLLLG